MMKIILLIKLVVNFYLLMWEIVHDLVYIWIHECLIIMMAQGKRNPTSWEKKKEDKREVKKEEDNIIWVRVGNF